MHRSLVSCTQYTKHRLSYASIGLSTEKLLQRLSLNRELDAEDAQNELRWMKQSLPDHDENKLALLVERRAKGEPLQYMLGSTDFGPLILKCRHPTLIPRPETADIFERLASLLRNSLSDNSRPLDMIDLCTGSAPIPLLLRHYLGTRVRVKGFDLSESAIKLARENIASTGLDIQVAQADVMSEAFAETVKSDMGGRVDLVISNPPYIPLDEYRELPASVRDWEDPSALLGDVSGEGTSGLRFYERIAELLPVLLKPKTEMEAGRDIPRVAVEIGSSQGKDVMSIMRGGGMGRAEVWQDQFGKDRMVIAWN